MENPVPMAGRAFVAFPRRHGVAGFDPDQTKVNNPGLHGPDEFTKMGACDISKIFAG